MNSFTLFSIKILILKNVPGFPNTGRDTQITSRGEVKIYLFFNMGVGAVCGGGDIFNYLQLSLTYQEWTKYFFLV